MNNLTHIDNAFALYNPYRIEHPSLLSTEDEVLEQHVLELGDQFVQPVDGSGIELISDDQDEDVRKIEHIQNTFSSCL
jgi:hypothetical protein